MYDIAMKIPKEVKEILSKLKEHGFEAYIVGGCVRDIIMKKEPEDWDITTNATPQQIQEIFPKSFYSNKFFTVTVQTESKNEKVKEIEITTFRKESQYKDRRHPEKISFAKNVNEDLSRRDFTINAIALAVKNKNGKEEIEIIDPFNGQKDIKNKIIKAVGNPKERFQEDALRMLRAVRLSTTLNFKIEENTKKAIKENSDLISFISKERIRDEFIKIIMSERAASGIELLRELMLLKQIIPELEEGYGVSQNKHHIYDCYHHNLYSLDYAAKKNFSLHVIIASLLHDVGKPRVKKGDGPDATFYTHEIVGAKMAYQILNRLKFPKKDILKIVKLIRYHLFYYNVGEVSESSIRRLIRNVGKENMEELLQLRMADRIGSGVPKAEPYKLRHLRYLIEKVSTDPISTKMLKVNGYDIMETLNIKPSPKIGQILTILLEEVLDDPAKNSREYLISKIKELGRLSDEELKKIYEKAKSKKESLEEKIDREIKKKYYV
jgi:poly(A) polymerase/tRNA nucleotidyltransferase (CCA-adding enzyme)